MNASYGGGITSDPDLARFTKPLRKKGKSKSKKKASPTKEKEIEVTDQHKQQDLNNGIGLKNIFRKIKENDLQLKESNTKRKHSKGGKVGFASGGGLKNAFGGGGQSDDDADEKQHKKGRAAIKRGNSKHVDEEYKDDDRHMKGKKFSSGIHSIDGKKHGSSAHKYRKDDSQDD